MKNLIIVGAGGFGREVLSYAIDILAIGDAEWKIKGFIDDNLNALSKYSICDYNIISTIRDYDIEEDDVFVCAIAEPKIKLEVCRELMKKGAKFINFIHPYAKIMDRAKIGCGIIMAPYSCIGPDCTVGDFVTINRYTSCGHDAIIDDGCTLSSFCDVTGFSNLKEGVFMGSHASVTPGIKVYKYAKIAAGSVVFKNVKEEQTVFGNPARQLF